MRKPTEKEIALLKLHDEENIHWLGHPDKEAYSRLLVRRIDTWYGVPVFVVALIGSLERLAQGATLAVGTTILLGSYGLARFLAVKYDDHGASDGYAITDHRVVVSFIDSHGRFVARSLRFSDIAGIRIKMLSRDIGSIVITSRLGWWSNISFNAVENPCKIESLLNSLKSTENTHIP